MSEVMVYATSREAFFSDLKEAARRIDAGDMTPSVARIGFERAEMLLKALTPNRWTLLRDLRKAGPASIRSLAGILGRDYRGVHADVTALIDIGLIARDEAGKISVPWSKITAELKLDEAA